MKDVVGAWRALPGACLTVMVHIAGCARGAALEKRFMDCTLESETQDDCDVEGYLYRVGSFAAPGVVMAILTFLAIPFYILGKYCIDCCGGKDQAPNCCFPNRKFPARYSEGDLIRPRVFLLLGLVVAIASVAWSYSGILDLFEGMNDVEVTLRNIPAELQTRVDAITASLTVETYDRSTDTSGEVDLFTGSSIAVEADRIRNELKIQIDSSMATYSTVTGFVPTAMYALFLAPPIFMFAGLVAGLCSWRAYVPMGVLWWLLLSVSLLWLAHGMFSAMSMGVADLCAEIRGMAAQQTNVLPVVMGCEDSLFDTLRVGFEALERVQSSAACTTLMEGCYNVDQSYEDNIAQGRIYECPPASSADCAEMGFPALLTLSESYWYIHPLVTQEPSARANGFTCSVAGSTKGQESDCTMDRCAEECRQGDEKARSSVGRVAKDGFTRFSAAAKVSNTRDLAGSQFTNCDPVIRHVWEPTATSCRPLTSGLKAARQASGLECVGAFFGLFALVWGAKRFLPLSEAGKPQINPELAREMHLDSASHSKTDIA